MLSLEQCREVLGSERTQSILQHFQNKGLNKETVYRVLDYLACHQAAFPNLDTKVLENNLVNNLKTNIIHQGPVAMGMDAFKTTKSHKTAIKRMVLTGGYTNGESVVVKKLPLSGMFKSFKFMQERLDSVIRHELDHVATATFSKPLTAEDIQKIVNLNVKSMERTIGCDPRTEIPEINKKIANLIANEQGKVKFASGIDGRPNSAWRFGSTSLNEGVTKYKQRKMDQFANGGKSTQSRYDICEKIATHMIQTVGADKFLSMQESQDFEGVTKSYMEATGKTPEYMAEFYKNLDIEAGREKISTTEKMTRLIQKVVGTFTNKNTNMIQSIGRSIQLT